MADPIVLYRSIQGELPFSLNLPEGNYPIDLDGMKYQVELLQNRIAVPVTSDAMMMGKPSDLQSHLSERWDSLYKFDLRTIVMRVDTHAITSADLVEPNDEQLVEAASTKILRHDHDRAGDPKKLKDEAKSELAQLSLDDRTKFRIDTAVRLTADKLFPANDVQQFCRATNILIRCCMASFNDFFVQEITENYFSGTAFHGILVQRYCNGQRLDGVRHTGGLFPYMVRRPWFEHPDAAVTAFRTQLENAPDPDPVKLLNVRARSLLKRGGYRSAVIEASAAFDLCLVRKIRSGYSSKGKADAEIDTILGENRRDEDRAKKILREATGSSAADLDPPVWQRFVAHRTQRGKVAHAATEPSEAEATAAVEDMIRITELIEALAT